jgi:hypothetical protein
VSFVVDDFSVHRPKCPLPFFIEPMTPRSNSQCIGRTKRAIRAVERLQLCFQWFTGGLASCFRIKNEKNAFFSSPRAYFAPFPENKDANCRVDSREPAQNRGINLVSSN